MKVKLLAVSIIVLMANFALAIVGKKTIKFAFNLENQKKFGLENIDDSKLALKDNEKLFIEVDEKNQPLNFLIFNEKNFSETRVDIL